MKPKEVALIRRICRVPGYLARLTIPYVAQGREGGGGRGGGWGYVEEGGWEEVGGGGEGGGEERDCPGESVMGVWEGRVGVGEEEVWERGEVVVVLWRREGRGN